MITNVEADVPNPFKESWDYWGTRMIRVFGSGQVSDGPLGPYRSVPFELGLYASKDGTEVRYNGRVYEGSYPPAVPHGGSGHADALRA